MFDLGLENFFGSGKNSRIIDAKEAFIFIGKESGASITELSKFVGIDQSNASRRHDAARAKLLTDSAFAETKDLIEQIYRARIA